MNSDERKPTRYPPRRREGARYETCRECGLEWNVSEKKKIPLSGYLCPRCWIKYKYERL